MNESDARVLAAYNAMAAKLQVIYPGSVTEIPPEKYVKGLTWSLWNNDAELLMKVLDGEDINPWEISFVEDGLGDGSPDMQSMIEFAARKGSWACVAELVEHYQDCQQGGEVFATMKPALVEYELATDPERIEWLQKLMTAANVGYAKHIAAHDNSGGKVFYPNFACGYPKSNRFIFKHFSKFTFSEKSLGPLINKRLALRQMALSAISDGDRTALASALNSLNANARAFLPSKKVCEDGLTGDELETFASAALGCGYPECVNAVLTKAIEFKKARSVAKSFGKKADAEQRKLFARADIINIMNKVLHVAKTIDHQCDVTNLEVPTLVGDAIEKALFSVIFESADRYYIDYLKRISEDRFKALMPCVNIACMHAESAFERQDIKAAVSGNRQAVEMPRERVRL